MSTATETADGAANANNPYVLISRIPRQWKWALIVGIVGAIAGIIHMESMLLAGDWSFWADWKDRQWWPLITPVVNLIIPAALQYILWEKVRIPVGATIGAVLLLVATWVSRFFSFHLWAHLPLNYIWPETLIIGALLMDIILLLTKSLVITSVLGSFAWGGLFWVANYPALAPFMQPIIFHDQLMTVADYLSFQNPRSQGPEYLRMIEEGHLRALVGDVVAIVGFFAAMCCVATYWLGVAIGKYIGLVPMNKAFGLHRD